MTNEEKLHELETRMRKAGVPEDKIKTSRYYSPCLYRKYIACCVPLPKILYWRVRAVYTLYGHMKDSKTKAPLFNENAWKKANNILKEILNEFYSDPLGVQWYTKRLKKNGSVTKIKYGMETINCAGELIMQKLTIRTL